MTLPDLVRSYRDIDPVTGLPTPPRSDRSYAAILGVSASLLSRFYSGDRRNSWTVLRAFLRTFPNAAPEVATAMQVEEAAHVA